MLDVLTYYAGSPERPRGHALLFFRDADERDNVWATYLVVAPIAMDLAKYIPAAFAQQFTAQMGLATQGPSAYPLPPMPEKIEGGLPAVERLAALRDDDVLDGGVLRVSDPWQALQPITSIGQEYAEKYTAYVEQAPNELDRGAPAPDKSPFDVDDLLLQVMPDREKIEKLARFVGTLRYAVEGHDDRLAAETVDEMGRIGRHLSDKYQVPALLEAARSSEPRAGELASLYIERCYKLADEDYAALSDLDRRIATLRHDTAG